MGKSSGISSNQFYTSHSSERSDEILRKAVPLYKLAGVQGIAIAFELCPSMLFWIPIVIETPQT